MRTLFIDTHSEKLTVIIKDGEKTYIEESEANRSHSEIAMPIITKLFIDRNLKPEDIDEVIVVRGPGSFTGVRIGVTIAKTLAYSLNIPIKTITSLEMYGVSSNEEYGIVTVKDSKGAYSALKNGCEYTNFMYQRTQEFIKYIEENNYKVIESCDIDIEKVLDYLKDKPALGPHEVNPIYIKEIML